MVRRTASNLDRREGRQERTNYFVNKWNGIVWNMAVQKQGVGRKIESSFEISCEDLCSISQITTTANVLKARSRGSNFCVQQSVTSHFLILL